MVQVASDRPLNPRLTISFLPTPPPSQEKQETHRYVPSITTPPSSKTTTVPERLLESAYRKIDSNPDAVKVAKTREQLGKLSQNEHFDNLSADQKEVVVATFLRSTTEQRDRLIKTFEKGSGISTSLELISTNPSFSRLTPNQQQMVMETALFTTDKGRSDLNTLLSMKDSKGNMLVCSPDSRSQSLINDLNALATKKLAEPLIRTGKDQHVLVEQLLANIVRPGDIDQGPAKTCGSTSIEIAMARYRTADYVRIAGELCVNGSARVVDPKTGRPESIPLERTCLNGNPSEKESNDYGPRSRISAIFQNSVLAWGDKSSNLPVNFDPKTGLPTEGMDDDGLSKVYGTLLLRRSCTVTQMGAFVDRPVGAGGPPQKLKPGSEQAVESAIQAICHTGNPAIASIDYPNGNKLSGHYVVVTGIITVDGRKYVCFKDPNDVSSNMDSDGKKCDITFGDKKFTGRVVSHDLSVLAVPLSDFTTITCSIIGKSK